jgi:hypothetical protein
MYDFDAMDIVQLKERASQLEESQKGMKKKVNPKVMNMIDKWVVFVRFYAYVLTFMRVALRRGKMT